MIIQTDEKIFKFMQNSAVLSGWKLQKGSNLSQKMFKFACARITMNMLRYCKWGILAAELKTGFVTRVTVCLGSKQLVPVHSLFFFCLHLSRKERRLRDWMNPNRWLDRSNKWKKQANHYCKDFSRPWIQCLALPKLFISCTLSTDIRRDSRDIGSGLQQKQIGFVSV